MSDITAADFALPEQPGQSIPQHHHVVDANDNNIPDHEELQTCCSGTSDRRFGVFLIQVLMSVALFALCIIKLGDENLDCEATQLYVSLLSFITGIWVKGVRV